MHTPLLLLQPCGNITVSLSATEPLYVAARLQSRAPGFVTLRTTCAAAVAVDFSHLRVTFRGKDISPESGIYELSAVAPMRNGFPHWIKHNEGPDLGVNIYHLYYTSTQWVLSSSPRGISESIRFRASSGAGTNFLGISSFTGGQTVAFSPVCPPGTFSQGSGLSLTCSACGAYQFAPPGSTSAAACACVPGAGRAAGSTTCAPCMGDTFRASTAANLPCNACPASSVAIDGAQAPAACRLSLCDRITM
jgi:hypothetical protein